MEGGGQKDCMWGKAQQRLTCKSSKPQQPLGNRGEQKGEQDALLHAGALGGRGPASYKGWVQSTKHPRSLATEVQQSSTVSWESVLHRVREYLRESTAVKTGAIE